MECDLHDRGLQRMPRYLEWQELADRPIYDHSMYSMISMYVGKCDLPDRGLQRMPRYSEWQEPADMIILCTL
jgi:hypothetical protein